MNTTQNAPRMVGNVEVHPPAACGPLTLFGGVLLMVLLVACGLDQVNA